MKILYYSAHPHLNLSDNTGYGTHMREVIAGFEYHGHEVKPLIIGGTNSIKPTNPTSPNKKSLKSIVKKFIPKIIWETIKDFSLIKIDKKNLLKLEEIIKEFQPDLIYERGYYMLQSGVITSKKHNIKHYIELNAPYVEERVSFSGKSLLLSRAKKIEKTQLKSANSIIVVSSALKKQFEETERSTKGKILVTPNAINPNSIKVNEPDQLNLKGKLGINNEKIIGFVGSIFPYHGVDLLIKSFAKIETKEITKLLIVGDGETLNELKKLTSDLKIENRVIFTGKVRHTEVFNYINLMDITVMPQSNWYGSPVKIFEYGYLKKAVIAPNYVPLKDVLIHRENGIMIEPSVKKLTVALNQLLTDEKLSTHLGEKLYNDITANHTWVKVAESILKFQPKRG